MILFTPEQDTIPRPRAEIEPITWTGTVVEGNTIDWAALCETKPLQGQCKVDGEYFYYDLTDRSLDGTCFEGVGTFLHHEHRRRVLEGID
jgi:hypothetical protein